jgi:hypothetical protein
MSATVAGGGEYGASKSHSKGQGLIPHKATRVKSATLFARSIQKRNGKLHGKGCPLQTLLPHRFSAIIILASAISGMFLETSAANFDNSRFQHSQWVSILLADGAP